MVDVAVKTWKNSLTAVPECRLLFSQFSRGSVDVADTCNLCLTPYEGCATVDKLRKFTIPLTGVSINDIEDPDEALWLREQLVDQELMWEDISGCHWTSEIDESEGGGTTLHITFDLSVADDTPGVVDYTLTVTVANDTELGGNVATTLPLVITYTLNNTDPWFSGEKTFTTAASAAARTLTFNDAPDPDETVIFPASFVVTAVDP